MTVSELSTVEYEAILRSDLAAFIERSFRELNPQTEFRPSPYIDLLASRLEDCRTGKVRRLIVNLPPRSLKSHAASVALPAWLLGHDPSKQIICASYGQDLADKHARDCRTLMQSPFYCRLFRRTVLARDKTSVDDFATTDRGFRMATSVGGTLTGRGGDVLVLDDILKPDEALSEVRRRGANEWYLNTLFTRLNDKQEGIIIIVMQRLHQEDLVGELLERDSWEQLVLPAIAVKAECYGYRRFGSSSVYTRKAGEVLHPERDSLEIYRQIRETIGEYNFQSQYQQDPVSREGGLIKRDWIKYYEPDSLPNDFWHILQSWDTAHKSGEANDYSVCTTWGLSDTNFYLLDVFRKRLTFPELKRAVGTNFHKFNVSKVLIEDKSSGTALLQDLPAEGVYCLEAYQPEHGMDKYMRLAAQSPKFEAGRVFLPTGAPWLDAYLQELTGFPGGKHDDQADSTSQALEFLGRMAPWGGGTFRGLGVRVYERC